MPDHPKGVARPKGQDIVCRTGYLLVMIIVSLKVIGNYQREL